MYYILIRFIFNNKWRAWIKACVLSSNMVVLVNGSLTLEIKIYKGLNQGDPLAHFCFLLMAEGLSRLIQKAYELSLFSGFKVNPSNFKVSHL